MKLPIIIGVIALIAVFVTGAYVTEFTSYLGNNPTTCNNCHVMDAAYEGWYHGAHQRAATCNDCHTPHDFIPKYYVKAKSGYHHVTAFIFGPIPDAIRATEASRQVVQENCVRCHLETVDVTMPVHGEMDGWYCFQCHRNVAHGERGLSILPYQHQEEYKK
jgi:cytochrome c nitrite reductase small subunit